MEEEKLVANGDLIRSILRKVNWSQEGLADAAGIARSTLSNVLKGQKVSKSTLGAVVSAIEPEYRRLGFSIQLSDITLSSTLPNSYGLLGLPTYDWSKDKSPGALLRADGEVVPFRPRKTEQNLLDDWANLPDPLSIGLLTGEGGVGKTRLAREFCHDLLAKEWTAGFLGSIANEHSFYSGIDSICGESGKCLMVVDYLDRLPSSVSTFLNQLASKHRGRNVLRILFIDRSADGFLGQWPFAREYRDRVSQHLGLDHELASIDRDPKGRKEAFNDACEAFSESLDIRSDNVDTDVDFADPNYSRILMIHMLSLGHVHGSALHGEFELLDYHLNRESQFWLERARRLDIPSVLQDYLGAFFAKITLQSGCESQDEAVAILKSLSLFRDQPMAVLLSIAGLFHSLYPGAKWIEPLAPDILGEHLFAKWLESPVFRGELLESAVK